MPSLRLPDTTLHYVREGRGAPPIVFVHGALCDHADWRHQLAHFAATHEVLALDLHGHGASDRTPGRIDVEHFAADLVALLDALGLERAVLVGHSMGCRVLLQTWSVAPQRVAALVFVDGAYLVPALQGELEPQERARRAAAAHARAAATFAEVEPAVRVRTGFRQMFFDPRFDAERDAIIARAAALPSHVARELMPAFARWDVEHLERVLATVSVPALVLASTFLNVENRRVSLASGISTPWLDACRALAPAAEVHRLHGMGHFPTLEDPAGVNATIDAFLQRHGLGGG
jgi:pimeloyl-ACP methyl ester carboxylesterase